MDRKGASAAGRLQVLQIQGQDREAGRGQGAGLQQGQDQGPEAFPKIGKHRRRQKLPRRRRMPRMGRTKMCKKSPPFPHRLFIARRKNQPQAQTKFRLPPPRKTRKRSRLLAPLHERLPLLPLRKERRHRSNRYQALSELFKENW